MKNKKKFLILFIFIFSLSVISFFMTTYLQNTKTTQIDNLKNIVLKEALTHFNTLTEEDTWEGIHSGFVVDGGGSKKKFGDVQNPIWEKWQLMRQHNKNKYYYKITGLETKNISQLPDRFEKKGLLLFEKNKNQSYFYETGNNLEKFDFIGKLEIKESCLLCHAQQGYEIGDIRGGIRISIPTQIYEKSIFLANKVNQELKWVVYVVSFFIILLFYILISTISKRKDDVEKLNKNLEKKVLIRTKKLEKNYRQLKETQEELIQAEKLSSLAEMVAGVAHEINTPIGMALTDISYLNEETKGLLELYKKDLMTEKLFNEYLDQVEESSDLVTINLKRGANLIKSFKQVAVDQSSDEDRDFNVKENIHEIILSLNNVLKRTQHTIEIDINESLSINSNPGAFSQILTNFIMNSVIHGFENKEEGIIEIIIGERDSSLYFTYKDNGKGMNKKAQTKIFDPFYTTKRHKGGSGLGMHIIYNIITKKFNGTIKVESQINQGIKFTIVIPL